MGGRADRCLDKNRALKCAIPQGPHGQLPPPSASRAHILCPASHQLTRGSRQGRGEEMPTDPRPTCSLPRTHLGERNWKVLMKMRFLDVLWILLPWVLRP